MSDSPTIPQEATRDDILMDAMDRVVAMTEERALLEEANAKKRPAEEDGTTSKLLPATAEKRPKVEETKKRKVSIFTCHGPSTESFTLRMVWAMGPYTTQCVKHNGDADVNSATFTGYTGKVYVNAWLPDQCECLIEILGEVTYPSSDATLNSAKRNVPGLMNMSHELIIPDTATFQFVEGDKEAIEYGKLDQLDEYIAFDFGRWCNFLKLAKRMKDKVTHLGFVANSEHHDGLYLCDGTTTLYRAGSFHEDSVIPEESCYVKIPWDALEKMPVEVFDSMVLSVYENSLVFKFWGDADDAIVTCVVKCEE